MPLARRGNGPHRCGECKTRSACGEVPNVAVPQKPGPAGARGLRPGARHGHSDEIANNRFHTFKLDIGLFQAADQLGF